MVAKKRKYECLGGPLDGKKVRRGLRFVQPDGMIPHYYRLITLLSSDRTRETKFYHYFGTSLHRACTKDLCMIPMKAKFWPVKKS